MKLKPCSLSKSRNREGKRKGEIAKEREIERMIDRIGVELRGFEFLHLYIVNCSSCWTVLYSSRTAFSTLYYHLQLPIDIKLDLLADLLMP